MKTWPCGSALALVSLLLLGGCQRATGESAPAASTTVQEISDDDLANLGGALTNNYLAVRLEAIKSLGAASLNPKSSKAAQVVQWLLDHRRIEFNDYEDEHVEAAMRVLGPVAVAEVERQALSSETSEVSNACEAMRSMGSEFYAAFQPLLTKMLQSDQFEPKWGALSSLEKMGPAGQDLLPLIKPYLTDEDFQLQIIALRAIAAIGPPAMVHEEIVRDLTVNGQNVSVKSHALRTLGYIAAGDPKQAQAAAEVIGKNLKEFPFATKSRALEGLLQLQANAAPAAEIVKELIHDQTGLAPQAAVVNGYITGDWSAAVKLLVSQLKDHVVGMECLALLRKLGPKAAPAESALQAMTTNEDEIVALMAVDALAGLVNVTTKADLEQLGPDQRTMLDRIATHLQKLATQGEIEPHHRAGVLVEQWHALGWQPPSPPAPQPPPPASGE
ncbi:MAG: hypothetical protein Q8M16_23055 [Pirellulaceae bacterium]|nr:hypothetical protein [Pirellulaceae bacterium]